MSVEAGQLDLPVAIPATEPTPREISERAHRAVQDGWGLAACILLSAAVVAIGFEHSLSELLGTTLLFSIAWIAAVQAVQRSLHTVRAVVGKLGLAFFGSTAGTALAGAGSYWLESRLPRHLEMFTMAVLVFASILALEVAKAHLFDLRARLMVVGAGRATHELIKLLAYEPKHPFRLVGVVDDVSVDSVSGMPVLGGVASLHDQIKTLKPDLVVVAADRGRPEIFAQLAESAALGFRVVGLPEFYEHAFARVPIRGMTNAWFMSVLHLYQRPYPAVLKRGFDLCVAGIGLLLTAPLFLLIALFVRAGGEGPVFYKQARLGEDGRIFTILKFRTMCCNAEENGAIWARVADPRVTPVGRILRRTRLDELPQLINVIRGEMSIVGPRPERPEFLEMLEDTVPFWSRRHLLRPGITGWAQLRSGYAADSEATETKLAYDLWYLRHRSLIVDLVICARTIPSLLLAAGR